MKWIPVEKKHPMEGEGVLVSWFHPGMAEPVILCGYHIEGIWFRTFTPEKIEPMYWMPMPSYPRYRHES